MTDLTDRMRTCAAFLLSCDLLGDLEAQHDMSEHRAVTNAANLLIEASNALEGAQPPLGPPMEIIEPVKAVENALNAAITAHFHDPGVGTLPHQPSPKACPKCDSRATKTTRIKDGRVMLACPVCSSEWEWKPQARWT